MKKIILILLIAFIYSCSPQHRIEGIIKRNPIMKDMFKARDTIYIRNTTSIPNGYLNGYINGGIVKLKD